MDNKLIIADLYREIGNLLRSMGAERVYLYSSQTLAGKNGNMELKIVTDGEVDTEAAKQQIERKYPSMQVEIANGNEPEYMALLEEAMTDSIQI